MTLDGKRVLVVGSSGFVGSHLKKMLAQVKNYVVFELNRGENSIEKKIKAAAPDIVFYCTGVVSSPEFDELFEGNVTHLKRMLQVCEKHAKESVIVAMGSAAVYGDALPPIKENTAMAPLSQYGVSMQMRSDLIAYFRRRGLKVVEARLFNVIGPGLSQKTSIGSFLEQIERTKGRSGATIVTGPLFKKRDFVDVRDVAIALLVIAEEYKQDFEIFNVCSGKSVEVGEVLATLIDRTGIAINVKSVEGTSKKDGDIKDSFGDPSLLYMATGWKCKYSLEETADFCLKKD